MSLYDSGIVMTNGFSVAAKKPADLKFLADTVTDRDKYVTDNLAYEGMLVFVKEDSKTYQYLSTGWKEFGFNAEDFAGSVYDGLDSDSTILALSARQGKVLNTNINNHIKDAVKHITDAERTTWNAKANTTLVTQTANGLMSSSDKVKLDGIETGANKYVHPANHPADMITQDSTHRFVTDAEKDSWNNIVNNLENSTPTSDGLMSAEDKKKLDGIAEGANNYVHPSYTAKTSALYKLTIDNTGHSSAATPVVKSDITALGIPAQDTTYGNASQTSNGLMSKEDKAKLDSIDAATGNYVHPATHPATMIVEDTTHRFITDTERTTWNAKASTTVATQTANGLMSSSDKIKLDGIATGANNYTHPATHPASIITQDATHRFVTDAQIATWNAGTDLTNILARLTKVEQDQAAMLAKLKTAIFM